MVELLLMWLRVSAQAARVSAARVMSRAFFIAVFLIKVGLNKYTRDHSDKRVD